jgi:hypothetical protein
VSFQFIAFKGPMTERKELVTGSMTHIAGSSLRPHTIVGSLRPHTLVAYVTGSMTHIASGSLRPHTLVA